MPFVKLDCDILRSTLWLDREARDVFITALLLAEPRQITEPMEQIKVGALEETGWVVPPGWYGFVPASGPGLVHLAGCEDQAGMDALRRMGEPESESRSRDFGGRRLVRVDGGFIVLNFMKYRDKDFGAAERMRLLRRRRRACVTANSDAVTANSDVGREQRQSTENVGRKEELPALPPADRAERAIQQTTDALRTRLYALISEMSDEDPKHRDPTELMRLVTAYDKADGRRVNGVVNAHLLTHERVEKSIADAEAILADWRKSGTGQGQAIQPAH